MTNKAKRQAEPPMNLDPSRLWTFDEAKYYLRCGDSTLRGYIRTGQLPAMRLGGDNGRLLLLKKADLDSLLVPVNVEKQADVTETGGTEKLEDDFEE